MGCRETDTETDTDIETDTETEEQADDPGSGTVFCTKPGKSACCCWWLMWGREAWGMWAGSVG